MTSLTTLHVELIIKSIKLKIICSRTWIFFNTWKQYEFIKINLNNNNYTFIDTKLNNIIYLQINDCVIVQFI